MTVPTGVVPDVPPCVKVVSIVVIVAAEVSPTYSIINSTEF